jgi:hypothetical protein
MFLHTLKEGPLLAALLGTIGLFMLGSVVDWTEFDTRYEPLPPITNATPVPIMDLPVVPPMDPVIPRMTPVKHVIVVEPESVHVLLPERNVILNFCHSVMRSWYCPVEYAPSYGGDGF